MTVLELNETCSPGQAAAPVKPKRARKPAGQLLIQPDAEAVQKGPSNVTANQEQGSYDHAQAEYQLRLKQQEADIAATRQEAAIDAEERKAAIEDKARGTLGRFFGKDWSPAAQTAAIIGMVSLASFLATFLPDPERFTDAQKALLGFVSTAFAFLIGQRSK